MTRPTKAALAAEVERLLADYAAACAELRLCREALRRERLARWGFTPIPARAPPPSSPRGAPADAEAPTTLPVQDR